MKIELLYKKSIINHKFIFNIKIIFKWRIKVIKNKGIIIYIVEDDIIY